MHSVVAAFAVVALLPAGAGVVPTPEPATAVAAPATAAARASLTLKLHYEMQCGQPGRGTVVIAFPAAAHVPRTLEPRTVLVNGAAARKVQLAGRTVRVTLPPPPKVMCMVIGPGTLTISFARAFGFANPSKAGRYAIGVRVGARAFTPNLTVG